MKKLIICILCLISCTSRPKPLNYDFTTVFETSNGAETATYEQTITFYTNLAEVYSEVDIKTIGETDSGKPLHLVTLNRDKVFDFDRVKTNKKQILLINNGIHPGESDGIDATMMLFRDIVNGTIPFPEHTVLVTIPIYNIGGSLNRNSTTRTNQNGPKSYGFRGNARNYDLNRDFIKCDTKNTRSFSKIFHMVEPDVFIENHVSNGADYQYTLTHLFTQHNKLGERLGNYLETKMRPSLEQRLKQKSWDITPYVNVYNRVPDEGFSQFMDYPRYSTGFTTLWNTLGMMVETHMLKPYSQRVEGTYELMKSMIDIVEEDHNTIQQLRKSSFDAVIPGSDYTLQWEVDTTRSTNLLFKGYEGRIIESELTGGKRLKYYRDEPFEKTINYQNHFKPTKNIEVPKYYVIPNEWFRVIELLKINQVEMTPISKDTIIRVESYKIDSYQSRQSPYEGHYQHYNTTVMTVEVDQQFSQGDFLVSCEQNSVRYLLETLEPEAIDSFFNWNFFDTILQQKAGFSAYVWEDKAKEILKQNPKLQREFTMKKTSDSLFANNSYKQLDWIHKHSMHYEKSHLQYHIYRIK